MQTRDRMEDILCKMLIRSFMFIPTEPGKMKEAIFIEGESCAKCHMMKPHIEKRAKENGHEFLAFKFDDTSVKEFNVQAVPMLVIRTDGIVNEILNEDGIVHLLSNK